MYNIKLENYVPEPHPATSDMIVAAHYYAAWKKGAAGLHNGFEDLHDYPEFTPLMGYYDEENPEVCDWEIKWAVEHGINCFIHCWYRLKQNENKPVTPADLRCGHGLHEALFNAKYQNFMKFAIMFESSPRWAGTNEKDMLENLMPFWCENYFTRQNYLVIDNKPVVFIYNQARLAADGFKNAESQRETFDKCREYAKKYGFDGVVFGMCNCGPFTESNADTSEACGYDLLFNYISLYSPKESHPSGEEMISNQVLNLKKRLEVFPDGAVATASCAWNPVPRMTQRWKDMGFGYQNSKLWQLSPDEFREEIRRMKEVLMTLPEKAWGRRIFMIDNWNEWDEGHFVAPSLKYGFRYLQAIREELTARDNLPDYRTPQELCFNDLNKHWKTPNNK